jgi:hypothetical protein
MTDLDDFSDESSNNFEFPDLIREFIYNQQHFDDVSNASISDLPMFYMPIAFDSIPQEVLKNIALYGYQELPTWPPM